MFSLVLFDSIKKKVKGNNSGGSSNSRTLPSSSSSAASHQIMGGSPLKPCKDPSVSPFPPPLSSTTTRPSNWTSSASSRAHGSSSWKSPGTDGGGDNTGTRSDELGEDAAHTYCMAENILDIMVSLYNFKAQNDTELSFEKGDRLEILDRPACDPDWYKARNTQAQIGLVPKNYLIELSQYLTQDVNNASSNDNGNNNNNNNNSNRTAPNCDELLNDCGQDGDFLIRESETNIGDFSVSLKAPGRNKHFRVHVEGTLFCIGQRKFGSLLQLVEHYQRAPIFTSSRGEKLFLIRALPK
ncbi:Uncharacterized protein FKW44_006717 [Caligus rogercresseyi]|uniref:Cytoplasmic protein NCK1 n=1 Tax=Caligus rogercresseyi TaxID=217165 RepID=A0A7T8KDS0_CALRO|nr:Uncharacterized protein FKW44_006717 [Caligus rogercresseyi]